MNKRVILILVVGMALMAAAATMVMAREVFVERSGVESRVRVVDSGRERLSLMAQFGQRRGTVTDFLRGQTDDSIGTDELDSRGAVPAGAFDAAAAGGSSINDNGRDDNINDNDDLNDNDDDDDINDNDDDDDNDNDDLNDNDDDDDINDNDDDDDNDNDDLNDNDDDDDINDNDDDDDNDNDDLNDNDDDDDGDDDDDDDDDGEDD